MSNANPMFEHAKYSHTIVNPKPRNIRSDKKKDVKIPVTAFQRQEIRLHAFEQGMTTTEYISMLMKEHLQIEYISDIHAYEYKDTKRYVHAKLDQTIHTQLVQLAIQWGVSQRAAATRILCFALQTK